MLDKNCELHGKPITHSYCEECMKEILKYKRLAEERYMEIEKLKQVRENLYKRLNWYESGMCQICYNLMVKKEENIDDSSHRCSNSSTG